MTSTGRRAMVMIPHAADVPNAPGRLVEVRPLPELCPCAPPAGASVARGEARVRAGGSEPSR